MLGGKKRRGVRARSGGLWLHTSAFDLKQPHPIGAIHRQWSSYDRKEDFGNRIYSSLAHAEWTVARIATGTSVADGASYTFLHSPWAGTCKSASMLKFLGAYALAKVLGFGLLGAIVIYLLIR